MRIAILGFGLIGGSIARALRRSAAAGGPAERHRIAAWSRRSDRPRAAEAAGIVDAAPESLTGAVDGADLVVLAAPPLACLELLGVLAGPAHGALAPAATVTDVASTKLAIVARAGELGIAFVGGHPMAGLEGSGWDASEANLFVDRPWVVCPGPTARPDDLDRVERLAMDCGARPLQLDPAAHDEAVAAISHAPLFVSAALAEAMTGRPDWPTAASLAAGGWRDMTRIARGDPEMGAGIAATNAEQVVAHLAAVRAELDAWITALQADEPDSEAIATRLAAVRDRLDTR